MYWNRYFPNTDEITGSPTFYVLSILACKDNIIISVAIGYKTHVLPAVIQLQNVSEANIPTCSAEYSGELWRCFSAPVS